MLFRSIADNDLDVELDRETEDDDLRRLVKKAMKKKAEEEEDEKPKKHRASEDDEDEKPKKKHSEDDEPSGKKSKWYSEGDDDDDQYKPEQRGTFRLWIPQGESRRFTIISPKAITVREHTVKSNGKFYQYTCLAPTDERCPLCENNNYPYLAKAFYVVDHSEYKNKKKETVRDQVRLLVMKQGSYQLLKVSVTDYYEGKEDWTYRGLTIKATRSEAKKSFNTGDVFSVKDKIKIKEDWEKSQEDLANEFKPLDAKLLKQKAHFSDDDEERPKKRRSDDAD